MTSRFPMVFSVTSGKGGVGKTNISVNLARCLSRRGKRVVQLDAALRHPGAVEGVAVGGVSKPFKAQGFDALLMIDSLAEAPQGDFEQEKENLYEDLYNKKMETFLKEYLDKLREKAVIEYRD